jgi:hypothetical protein
MKQSRFQKTAKNAFSVQSSAVLLGLSIPAVLTHAAGVSREGWLSGFAWAILAALAGCITSTVLNWVPLMNTAVPERSTWTRAIAAGFLLALALYFQGLALSSPLWSPFVTLSFIFIPWARQLWRDVFGVEALWGFRARMSSFLLLAAAILFLYPEFLSFAQRRELSLISRDPVRDLQNALLALPRCLSFMSALLFGAASSLLRPQDRSIPSLTFWSIPVAVAAIVLSLSGWLALHVLGERSSFMGQFHALPNPRLMAMTPAFLFGTVFLALRPHIQVKNALRSGFETSSWWQSLGLAAGAALSLMIFAPVQVHMTDPLACFSLLLGQFVCLRLKQSSVTFAPVLSVLTSTDADLPRAHSQGN